MNIVALFSTGKDSLVMLDILKKRTGINIIPVYLYYAKLDYINKRLKMYENFFNVEIKRHEHQENYKAKKRNVFGSSLDTWTENYKDWKSAMQWLMAYYKADKIATGYKKTDSLIRRGIIYGRKDHSLDYMIHPCADMNNKDVWHYIKKNKIPYPSDYAEGYTHEFCNFMTKESLLFLKKNHPDDIENLKMDFPLIESLFYTKD